ncbi:MAG TPA: thiamine pyrophosphate-binding protein [Devosia sp.]|nr:thiamine pyrophosphate-binding protein [Devosia sp.]
MAGGTQTGGELLVECLHRQGADQVFCVPGESYLAVLDAFHDRADQFNLVVCRQEGGAANMAEACGKLTGRPGICFVTRGPGATNASTGVHTAFQDSTPMVLFIGQVSREIKDREGFQEVDFPAMFAPLAKWAAEINDARRIPEYVHRAFQTAMAGRPGPVVLSLPEDMLTEMVSGDIEVGLRAEPIPTAAQGRDIDTLAHMLWAAERPLIIVGGGGWTNEAGRQLMAFAEANDVPVAASLRCQDYVDNTHPNYVGHFTIGAEPTLMARLKASDVVVALGPRLGEMTTAGYATLKPPRIGKPLVHIHPDPEELGRVYQADLAINAAPGLVAAALAGRPAMASAVRRDWVRAARAEYEQSLLPQASGVAVEMGQVIVQLRERLPADTIVASGAGNYTGWLHKHWVFRQYRTQLAPTSGAMGYGVPAAIAAAITRPGQVTLALAGDGCFQMHGQELATAAQYGAKVLFVVVNNGIYGTIRMHQEREYPGRVVATDIFNPDFVALAGAYGIPAERVERTEDFAAALDRALAAPGSALLELITDPEAISVRTTITRLRLAAQTR